MDKYYVPQTPIGNLGAGLASTNSMPKITQPNVGDKMLLLIGQYGVNVLQEGSQVPIDSEVCEVEVLQVKKAKIVLE